MPGARPKRPMAQSEKMGYWVIPIDMGNELGNMVDVERIFLSETSLLCLKRRKLDIDSSQYWPGTGRYDKAKRNAGCSILTWRTKALKSAEGEQRYVV